MFRKSILVAGDTHVWGLLAHSFFAREGFALLRAGDGDAAFAMVEEHDPALVIIDLGLSGMADCCLRIKNDPLLGLTPVLALMPADRPDLTLCQRLADGVQESPAESSALLASARHLLGITARSEPRSRLQIPVRCGKPGGKLHPGRILNLSVGGAFLATARLFPVDTPLTVEFTLPDGIAFACRGRVAWVNHPEWVKKPSLAAGMGLQFLDLDADQRLVLEIFTSSGGEEAKTSAHA